MSAAADPSNLGRYPGHPVLPATGLDRSEVLAEVRARSEAERAQWHDGFASGAVYHGDTGHIAFLNEVYAATSQLNPLHTDIWPSGVKYEREIVAMTAAMLNGRTGLRDPNAETGLRDPNAETGLRDPNAETGLRDPNAGSGDGVHAVGTVTSGGTESILLAMKAYRDHARATRGVRHGRIVCPVTAHAAFEKAAACFELELVPTAVDGDGRAVVDAVADAVDDRTVVVVGSAPSYPYGTIDPIAELSGLALERGIGFHTDACLGGFVLPWAERLGHEVPLFDFRLPGVTSMSCDTHKYGYAAKGTSVILYRTPELRHHQYFTVTDWPGGLYASPTFAGSRPGALSAACWAALVSIGEDGYLRATDAICRTTADARRAITKEVPEVRLVGESLFVLALAAAEKSLDIYRVNDAMADRGWALNGLHRPPAVHLAVTLRHTIPGVVERFVADLRASVDQVRATPAGTGGMAPIYGMANSIPDRGAVADTMRLVIDQWFD